jgi:hypothetical protein
MPAEHGIVNGGRDVARGDPGSTKEDRKPQDPLEPRGCAIQQQEADATQNAEQKQINEHASGEHGDREKLMVELPPGRREEFGKRRKQIEQGEAASCEPGTSLHDLALSSFMLDLEGPRAGMQSGECF